MSKRQVKTRDIQFCQRYYAQVQYEPYTVIMNIYMGVSIVGHRPLPHPKLSVFGASPDGFVIFDFAGYEDVDGVGLRPPALCSVIIGCRCKVN